MDCEELLSSGCESIPLWIKKLQEKVESLYKTQEFRGRRFGRERAICAFILDSKTSRYEHHRRPKYETRAA
jgi:hypothetical protein